MDAEEWAQLRLVLTSEGVQGAQDLGRFVNNTEYFAPSQFDERAAMPVLIRELPNLADPRLVASVAGHLRRPWARPTAYKALRLAFVQWARLDQSAAWSLGDALGNAATKAEVPELLILCQNGEFGTARQMLVMSLGRFGAQPGVLEALHELAFDADVVLHALSALRRVAGAETALKVAEEVATLDPDSPRGEIAARQARRLKRDVEKKRASAVTEG